MENLTKSSCEEFCTRLASAAPTPGGGGASALVGALGAALGGMVASLTLGKKKYAAVQGDMERLAARLESQRARLLALVEEDAAAFAPLARAYGLPKATPEEQRYKEQVMEEALYTASQPPLQMLKVLDETLVSMEEMAQKGSALALSDAGVGAALCRAALQGAVLNLLINAASLKDRARARALEEEARALVAEGVARADAIYAQVEKAIAR